MITEVVHTWHRTTDGSLFDNKAAAERWENECELARFIAEDVPKGMMQDEVVAAFIAKYPQIVEPALKQPEPVSHGEVTDAAVDAKQKCCADHGNSIEKCWYELGTFIGASLYDKFNITRKEV